MNTWETRHSRCVHACSCHTLAVSGFLCSHILGCLLGHEHDGPGDERLFTKLNEIKVYFRHQTYLLTSGTLCQLYNIFHGFLVDGFLARSGVSSEVPHHRAQVGLKTVETVFNQTIWRATVSPIIPAGICTPAIQVLFAQCYQSQCMTVRSLAVV